MESEAQRIERRLQDWMTQAERNKEARETKHSVIGQKREEAVRLEAEQATAEAGLEEQQNQLSTMRQNRETLQQDAARLTAELAGLEERRRGAEAAFQRIDRLHADLERRVMAIEQQRASAESEREQRITETAALAQREQELTALKAEALAQAEAIAAQAHEVRHKLAEMETQLKSARAALDQLRDDRSARASQAAKLKSDLEHLEASCLPEVNVDASELRADQEIVRIADEPLAVEEDTCRTLKQKIEQMGPVNMMALDEYKETADRHSFLETQRKDLMESIENTQQTIKEIDQISREKFDEAFARINENFGHVFTKLFHGGQAFLRLTDAENQAESGLEIVASPRARNCRMFYCSRAAKRHSPPFHCSSVSSSSSRVRSACSTKWMPRSTKLTSAASPICSAR